MKTGIELIADERLRVIEKEGFNLKHDQQYESEELLFAAKCYIRASEACHYSKNNITFAGGFRPGEGIPFDWPFSADWWKPSDDSIRNLEKAGQFIAAEIDRLLVIQQAGTF